MDTDPFNKLQGHTDYPKVEALLSIFGERYYLPELLVPNNNLLSPAEEAWWLAAMDESDPSGPNIALWWMYVLEVSEVHNHLDQLLSVDTASLKSLVESEAQKYPSIDRLYGSMAEIEGSEVWKFFSVWDGYIFDDGSHSESLLPESTLSWWIKMINKAEHRRRIHLIGILRDVIGCAIPSLEGEPFEEVYARALRSMQNAMASRVDSRAARRQMTRKVLRRR